MLIRLDPTQQAEQATVALSRVFNALCIELSRRVGLGSCILAMQCMQMLLQKQVSNNASDTVKIPLIYFPQASNYFPVECRQHIHRHCSRIFSFRICYMWKAHWHNLPRLVPAIWHTACSSPQEARWSLPSSCPCSARAIKTAFHPLRNKNSINWVTSNG